MKYDLFWKLFLFVFALSPGYAFEISDYNTAAEIARIQDAGAPRTAGNYIVLTYESSEKNNFVGAAFEKDNYSKIYPYSFKERRDLSKPASENETKKSKEKASDGIFILLLPKEDISEIKYRIIVDGIWMADPLNPFFEKDSSGIKKSIYRFPETERLVSPVVKNDHLIFNYIGKSKENVALCGTFNSWDPFMYKLRETSPGKYSITLKLAPGKYYYQYVINGNYSWDKLNPKTVWNSENMRISVLDVK